MAGYPGDRLRPVGAALSAESKARVEAHLYIVDRAVAKHLKRWPFMERRKEDLYQEGAVGLVHAAQDWVPAKGTFVLFAWSRVWTAIKNRNVKAARLEEAEPSLECELGRMPALKALLYGDYSGRAL